MQDGIDTDDTYQKCVKTLKKHFTPKLNVPYVRYEFRNTYQEPTETIEQYITRLHRKDVYSQFTDINESIRDHIIEKCMSHR